MNGELLVLYRPVSQLELDLFRESAFTSCPLRAPHQPIFYPVLVEKYGVPIVRDWNTRDAASGHAGHVTPFRIDRTYAERFQVQKVGNADALELWAPAEELADFDNHLIGPIEVIHEFRP